LIAECGVLVEILSAAMALWRLKNFEAYSSEWECNVGERNIWLIGQKFCPCDQGDLAERVTRHAQWMLDG